MPRSNIKWVPYRSLIFPLFSYHHITRPQIRHYFLLTTRTLSTASSVSASIFVCTRNNRIAQIFTKPFCCRIFYHHFCQIFGRYRDNSIQCHLHCDINRRFRNRLKRNLPQFNSPTKYRDKAYHRCSQISYRSASFDISTLLINFRLITYIFEQIASRRHNIFKIHVLHAWIIRIHHAFITKQPRHSGRFHSGLLLTPLNFLSIIHGISFCSQIRTIFVYRTTIIISSLHFIYRLQKSRY